MEQPRVAPAAREPHPDMVTLKGDLAMVICAGLWQLRHKLPDMTLQIEAEEVDKFKRALEYNEQKPKLLVHATHDRLVVAMVDASTGNMIIQSESEERDLDRKEAFQKLRATADGINALCADIRGLQARGEESTALTGELMEAAMVLAKAVR